MLYADDEKPVLFRRSHEVESHSAVTEICHLLAKYGLLSQVTWDKICSLKSTPQLLGINYQLVDNLSQGLG